MPRTQFSSLHLPSSPFQSSHKPAPLHPDHGNPWIPSSDSQSALINTLPQSATSSLLASYGWSSSEKENAQAVHGRAEPLRIHDIQISDLHQYYPQMQPNVSLEILMQSGTMMRNLYRGWEELSTLDKALRAHYPEHMEMIPSLPLPEPPRSNSRAFWPLRRTSSKSPSGQLSPLQSSAKTFMSYAQLASYLSAVVHHAVLGTTPELHQFLCIQPARSLGEDDSVIFEDGIHFTRQSRQSPPELATSSQQIVDAPEAQCALEELARYVTEQQNLQQMMSVPSDAMLSVYEESERRDRPSQPIARRHSSRKSVEDYELVKVLGKGCMGKVLLARERSSSRLFAIKAISKLWVASHGAQEIEHIRAEQRILAELSRTHNPFLIKLHCSFQTHENLFLVLDYVGGGDLATQLSKWQFFCETRSRFYCAEIILGVQELHRLGVIYRDLKPENVLLSPAGHIVLTDFGLSKQFRISLDCKEKTSTFCGTAEYLAPEVLREELYGYEVDWWSLGTFLYEMLTGMTPFWAEDQVSMYRRVLEDELEFPEGIIGLDAQDLIARLLTRDPKRRLGYGRYNGAQDIQRHPFFRQMDWGDLYHLRILPPYVPRLRNPTDVSNFDQEFLNMTPRLSVPSMQKCASTVQCGDGNCGCTFTILSQSVQDQFAGYSFAGGKSVEEFGWRRRPSTSGASFVTVSEANLGQGVESAAAGKGAHEIRVSSSWMNRYQMKRRRSSVATLIAAAGADDLSPNAVNGSPPTKCWRKDEDMEFQMDDV